MSEPFPPDDGDERRESAFPPAALIKSKSGVSIVWLIPLVAGLLGLFLGWRAINERGPEITISFRTAEGIEAGKTKVKFKEIEVGKVTSVEIHEDLTRVLVTAEMDKNAAKYLTDETRFWVVKPQISAGRVTGLSTLLSGAYIGMDPSPHGESQKKFIGLENPPPIKSDAEGRVFKLVGSELYSVDIGSPVYFRQLRVGEVIHYEMSEDGKQVNIDIFVSSPHDVRVHTDSRFWSAGGIDVTVSAEGVQVNTPSVIAMLLGGVAFDSPPESKGVSAEQTQVFALNESFRAARETRYTIKRRYLLYFSQSVGGLVKGSPVVFRGIKMGEVIDVHLRLDVDSYQIEVPVTIEIEPERIELMQSGEMDDIGRFERLVDNGLRAQLGMGNILTGQLQVEIDLIPDAEPAAVKLGGIYPELPTIPAPLEQLTNRIASIALKIDEMPIEEIGKDAEKSLAELRKMLVEARTLLAGVNAGVTPKLGSTMEEVELAVARFNEMVAPDSPISIEIRRILLEAGDAARSLRLLADYLERNPEALIRGKQGN